MKPIEPRIKPLVTALNKFSFITTFSSCEGHFTDSNSSNEWAEVRFRGDEVNCQHVSQKLPLRFSKKEILVALEIEKTYYNILTKTGSYWILKLTPLAERKEEKEKQTEQAIAILCKILEDIRTESSNHGKNCKF